MSDLYNEDFTLWTEQQATLLRRRAAGELVNDAELDWLNIAEEIESVGGNTRRELRNRLMRLLQHLLNGIISRSFAAEVGGRRSGRNASRSRICWRKSLLRARLPELFSAAYHRARVAALDETGLLDLPKASPFAVEQALGDELPEQ